MRRSPPLADLMRRSLDLGELLLVAGEVAGVALSGGFLLREAGDDIFGVAGLE